MKSPFPGMDPFLEQIWSDVHLSLTFVLRAQILEQLPEGLWARAEEHVSIDVDDGPPASFITDVSVTDRSSWGKPSVDGTSDSDCIDLAEPLCIEPSEKHTERWIEIVDTKDGNRVVTAIEVLSPANRVGNEGRKAYQRKQDAFHDAGVNLVEIDLLRCGSYIVSAPLSRIKESYRKTYIVSIWRESPGRWEVYPIGLREVLPAFRIPLRSEDHDIALNLQGALENCYETGQYQRALNYGAALEPLTDEEDSSWIAEVLGEKT